MASTVRKHFTSTLIYQPVWIIFSFILESIIYIKLKSFRKMYQGNSYIITKMTVSASFTNKQIYNYIIKVWQVRLLCLWVWFQKLGISSCQREQNSWGWVNLGLKNAQLSMNGSKLAIKADKMWDFLKPESNYSWYLTETSKGSARLKLEPRLCCNLQLRKKKNYPFIHMNKH